MDNEKKSRDERIKELLDAPISDALQTMKGPSLGDNVQVPGNADEDKVSDAADDDSSDKKIRIRKSRLTTLEKEIELLRSQVAQSSQVQERIAALENRTQEDEVPQYWKDAWGDTEQSKLAYKQQVQIMQQEFDRRLAEREAALRAEEAERAERIESIEQSFDEQMEELEETIGRDLTDNQKSELLDIVGEYSPQEDGKYLAYMPVSKAYELWSKGQSKDTGKRDVANIAGMQSSGGSAQQNSSWSPGNWRSKYGL